MTPKHNDAITKNHTLWLQWTGSTGAMLLLLVCGLMLGWTSPYIAQLTIKKSPFRVTLEEASWVVSLLTLGRLVGAIPGAVLMNYLGGRKTLIIIGIPMIISWVCIVLADSVGWLYAGRFSSGLGLGMAFSSFPLYLGEVASPEIRGTLVSFAMSGLSIGILAGNTIGACVSMGVFAYISLVPTVIYIAIFIYLPESPHYLIRKNRIENAKVSIVRYNPSANAELEVKDLQNFIKNADSIKFVDRLREFNIPANRKAGFIVIILFMFMQVSGINTLLFYMETILTNGELTAIKPSTMVIIAGAIGNISSLCNTRLADSYGRRTLLIISSAGVAASMITLGAHETLMKDGFGSEGLQWLLILSMIIFEAFFFMGLCPVPSMIVSELFAPNIKSIAACVASVSLGFFSFLSAKTYQPLVGLIGMNYVQWAYAIVMMSAMAFTLQVVPETKGKSLQEIQYELHNKYLPVNKHDGDVEKN